MKVTLRDIADRLSISTAAVSMALRDSPKVSEETRSRVLSAVKELGYQSNPYVSALMSARRKGQHPEKGPVIAVITSNDTASGWKERYHMRCFIAACEEVGQRLGLSLEIFWIGGKNMSAQRMNDILLNRGIRGAILMSHGVWGGRLDHSWDGIATVTSGVRRLTPDTDLVSSDFYGNMERALHALRGKGFERIGFAMDIPYPYANHNRWLSAYLMEQSQQKIPRLNPWLDEAPNFEKFSVWFEQERPEVIICVNPNQVMDWLRKMALDVPREVGVATISVAEAGGEISGIVENTETSGRLAIEMLVGRIHHCEFSRYEVPQHVVVEGHWNPGKTVRQRT